VGVVTVHLHVETVMVRETHLVGPGHPVVFVHAVRVLSLQWCSREFPSSSLHLGC